MEIRPKRARVETERPRSRLSNVPGRDGVVVQTRVAAVGAVLRRDGMLDRIGR